MLAEKYARPADRVDERVEIADEPRVVALGGQIMKELRSRLLIVGEREAKELREHGRDHRHSMNALRIWRQLELRPAVPDAVRVELRLKCLIKHFKNAQRPRLLLKCNESFGRV